ncbi:Com family DNA-binding transcriptional regulator [Sphingobium sp.]|uniref:Com family DNA-binding transcriptional regulator n=1 Tax=Sphingobium sp. TaxID=1912891 RepID=UPI003FA73255
MHASNDSACVSNKCASCRALLFKSAVDAIAGVIEIKCRRCGAFNCFRPMSPPRSPAERPLGAEHCGSTYQT